MARLFLAVWPPDDVVATLESLHRKDQRGVRFLPPENWHVTLRFLGDAHPGDVAAALDTVALPATHARLGPAVDVLEERVLVVPVTGLDPLADLVIAATRDIGTQRPRRRFVGHLTVARIKPHVAMPRALGALVEASFDVHEVTLVESVLRPEGARYHTVATWPVG
jgi:2'-5' RNA ligase